MIKKNSIKNTVFLVAFLPSVLFAQEYKTHLSRQFNLRQGEVQLYNVHGPVEVEGYDGTQVKIDIEETITADNQAILERGKSEVQIAFEQKAGSVTAYLVSPSDARPDTTGKKGGKDHAYKFNIAFRVRVPYQTRLTAKTVNSGTIRVKDVRGTLRLNNVNGDILIRGAKGATQAKTLNGQIRAEYVSLPPDTCSYKTLNGEIRVNYPGNLSADLFFKSRNGKFYSDFQETEILVPDALRIKDGGNTTVYKSSSNYGIRVGSGGTKFKFETLNGDIYVQKSHEF